MKKIISFLAVVAMMSTTVQAQTLTTEPAAASSSEGGTHLVRSGNTVIEAPVTAEPVAQPIVKEVVTISTDTIRASETPARPKKHYGLYEEELPRSVKRISSTRTVQQGDAPEAQPMVTDTQRLEVTPGPREKLSSKMAPPERASGKVTRTRTVRTIEPSPSKQ